MPRITRFKQKFWGFDTSQRCEPRPAYPVYAIALGPDDESGAVQLAGLTGGADGQAVVSVGCPWVGSLDGDQNTLIVTPRVAGTGAPDPLYAHTMDLLLIHDPSCPVPSQRAPLWKRRTLTFGGSPADMVAMVFGRKRVSISVKVTALTAPTTGRVIVNALAPDGNGGGAAQAIRDESGLSVGDVVVVSLGAGGGQAIDAGNDRYLWPCQAVYISAFAGAGLVVDAQVEAWD